MNILTRRLGKSRKAISPILATLLLIVIAVAAIVVTYAWIMTYLTSAGEQAGVRLFSANINFGGGGTTIQIDVGNSGDSDTEIMKIYIGPEKNTLVEQNQTFPTLPTPLNAGSITSIMVNYNWTASSSYYLKIISSAGQYIEFPEQAPAS